MSTNVPITVAHGIGIGPEILEASVALLGNVLEQGLEIVKTETLRSCNATVGDALSQGQ
jgi:isocitrate/isopropylmalate dehydrogenase